MSDCPSPFGFTRAATHTNDKSPPVREWENKKCTGGCAVKVSVVVVVSGGCV